MRDVRARIPIKTQQEATSMGIFDLLRGPTPEKLEGRGDALLTAGRWGEAKLAYEEALRRRTRQAGSPDPGCRQLVGKIHGARQALAEEHLRTAENLAEGGYYPEALETLALAREVSPEAAFQQAVAQRIQDLQPLADAFAPTSAADDPAPGAPAHGPDMADAGGDEFEILCHTLPDNVREAYMGYGVDFRTGYLALNRGDFPTAAHHLARAREADPRPESYIALELATAYLNLNRTAEARQLLEDFAARRTEALPAYQLLCEIYWEQKDFAAVEKLLASVPPDLTDSLAVVQLKGENLCQTGQLGPARDFYAAFLQRYGWESRVALRLAQTLERLGENDGALALYRDALDRCRSCRAAPDPEVRHRYAELRFAAGLFDLDLLELYLVLAQELPDNTFLYYGRLSQIYAHLGHEVEADRFRGFAQQAVQDRREESGKASR